MSGAIPPLPLYALMAWRERQLHLLAFDVAVGILSSDVYRTCNKSLLHRFVSSTQPKAEHGSIVTRTYSTFWSLRVAMNFTLFELLRIRLLVESTGEARKFAFFRAYFSDRSYWVNSDKRTALVLVSTVVSYVPRSCCRIIYAYEELLKQIVKVRHNTGNAICCLVS